MTENKVNKKLEKQRLLTNRKKILYNQQALNIKFLRRNPIIAIQLLFGITLMDSQKYIVQMAWNRPYVLLNCSRNFGKSFLGMVLVMLRALLYPNQRIYIVSSKGDQAKESFLKMEDIAKQRIDSSPELTDIFISELVKSANSDGFVHDKVSYRVELFNGSKIFTLNSIPDNIRGKRANLIFIDESAFCAEELISVVLPFLTQNMDFKLGKNVDSKMQRGGMPNQVIYSSSAGDDDNHHAKMYKKYATKMIIGDNRYFVADIPCDIPLNPYVDGCPMEYPLLTQQKIDDEMRIDPIRASREYFNKFITSAGEAQFIQRDKIRQNETFKIPAVRYSDEYLFFLLSFDPARVGDGSSIGIMGIKHDDKLGYFGEVVNSLNLFDSKSKSKSQMKTPIQLEILREAIVRYNGDNLDYAKIGRLIIDSGAGGGGIGSFADYLLEDWIDKKGNRHYGLIDPEHEIYIGEEKNHPNAKPILTLVSPKKYRSQMCGELEELIRDDVIKFPQQYNGRDYVTNADDDGELKMVSLSEDEIVALIGIEAMKNETLAIQKSFDTKTRTWTYDLPKEKKSRIHDDRFYTLLLLAHELHKIRKEEQLSKSRSSKSKFNLGSAQSCVTPLQL